MKYFTSLFIILLASISLSFACSFAPWTFCDWAQETEYSIIRGKIVQTFNRGLKLKVLSVYRGNETRQEITIWDGTDFNCTGIYSMAASNMGKEGQTVLVQVAKIDSIENRWEIEGDYRNTKFSANRTSLIQEGNHIIGALTEFDDDQRTHIDKIAKVLSKCVGQGINNPPFMPSGINTLRLFPNPASDFLFIANDDAAEAEVKVFNILGNLVIDKTIYIAEEGIPVQDLPSGIYVCVVKMSGLRYKGKFLVKH